MAGNEKRGRELRLRAKRTAKAERKRLRREQVGTEGASDVVDPSFFFPPEPTQLPPRPTSPGGASTT